MVVTRLSATRNCSAGTPIPINQDHSDIVKPCSSQGDSYIALRNAIDDNRAAITHSDNRSVLRGQLFSGLIQDEQGRALKDVKIIAPKFGILIYTDSFGRFSFKLPVAPGTSFRLIVEKEGYEVRTADPMAGNTSFNCSLRRL